MKKQVEVWKVMDGGKPVPFGWAFDVKITRGEEGRCGWATVEGPNAKANAHIISAAPEMLEALKIITHELEFQYSGANGPGGCFERARLKIVEQCRAAIAKAEGK